VRISGGEHLAVRADADVVAFLVIPIGFRASLGVVVGSSERQPRYAAGVVVVLIGAAGAGKTTIGRELAGAIGCRFVDGDDLHPPESIAKMRAGTGLTDVDRAPWLAALHRAIAGALDRREVLVVACSALKQQYRDALRGDLRHIRFVYLKAPEGLLRHRLTERPGHFAGPALLASQLAALEEPEDGLTLDAGEPPERTVGAIRYEFGL